jgi:hypothetical protein
MARHQTPPHCPAKRAQDYPPLRQGGRHHQETHVAFMREAPAISRVLGGVFHGYLLFVARLSGADGAVVRG